MNKAIELELDEKNLLALFSSFETILKASSIISKISETELKNTLDLLSTAYTDISLKISYSNTQTALAYNVRALLSLNAVRYQLTSLINQCKKNTNEYWKLLSILDKINNLEVYLENHK